MSQSTPSEAGSAQAAAMHASALLDRDDVSVSSDSDQLPMAASSVVRSQSFAETPLASAPQPEMTSADVDGPAVPLLCLLAVVLPWAVPFGILFVLLLSVLPSNANADLLDGLFTSEPIPPTLPTGTVLYELYQQDASAALRQSMYWQRRLADPKLNARLRRAPYSSFDTQAAAEALAQDNANLKLAWVSAALTLGLVGSARDVVAQLDAESSDEGALFSANASARLSLAQARLAQLDGNYDAALGFLDETQLTLGQRRPGLSLGALAPGNWFGVARAQRTSLSDGLLYNHAMLATDAARYELASSKLETLSNVRLERFGWFNLAVAARASGDFAVAEAAIGRVRGMPARTRQEWLFQQRATLAEALLAGETGAEQRASALLAQMPVDGPHGRHAALLLAQQAFSDGRLVGAQRLFAHLLPSTLRGDASVGTAGATRIALLPSASAGTQTPGAVPQQALPQEEMVDAAAVAAAVGYPYLIELSANKDGSTDVAKERAALAHYERAIAWLETHRQQLRKAQASAPEVASILLTAGRIPELGTALARTDEVVTTERPWWQRLTLWRRDTATDPAVTADAEADLAAGAALAEVATRLPGVDWQQWLAQQSVQSALRQWQRLSQLQLRMSRVARTQLALADIAQEHSARLVIANERLSASELAQNITHIGTELAAIPAQWPRTPSASWAAPTYQRWLRGLSSPDEAALWEDLGRARAVLTRLEQQQAELATSDPERMAAATAALAAAATRLRRLEGALAYRVSASAPERVWAVEKRRRMLVQRTALIQERAERLTRAANVRDAADGSLGRLAQIGATSTELEATVSALLGGSADTLSSSLVAQIQRDQERTEQALGFARLAVARLADEARFRAQSERARDASAKADNPSARAAMIVQMQPAEAARYSR